LATNGYINFRGYKTTAVPTWCDALLVDSNACNGVCTWEVAGDTIIAFATDAGISIVNKTESITAAYATLAGGFGCISYPGGDFVYAGVDGVGVYRVDISAVDYKLGSGDITPEG